MMRKHFKKMLLPLLLTGALCLATGCGQRSDGAEASTAEAQTEAEATPSASQEAEASERADQGLNTSETTEASLENDALEGSASSAVIPADKTGKFVMRGLSANELVSELTVGWNLGNSLDATGGSGLDSETSWGNPPVTQELIETVAAKGFNTIRIPTTWGNHIIDDQNTIDPAWMARVQEVCDMALDHDLYVILNMHHEDDWLIPDAAHIDEVAVRYTALWQQIADNFKDYGDHLILEGMNEPRVKGGQDEWNGGTKEVRECLNRLNQTFIDTVRNSGGHNGERLLLITTCAAQACDNAFLDYAFPADDNIALSLHAYTPYRFTYDENGEAGNDRYYDDSVAQDIAWVFENIEAFWAERQVPVIITECGSVVKNLEDGSLNTEEVRRWAEAYLSTAREHQFPCVLWDNNQFYEGNERFGLLNRADLTWYCPEVVDTIVSAAKG